MNDLPKRVVISGYYGFGNLGDEAILEATLAGLRERAEALDVTVISGNAARTAKTHEVKSIPRDRLEEILLALRGADLLLSGGGGLFQDVTSLRSLIYYLSVVFAARAMKVPVMIYGQSFGPLKRPLSRRLAKSVLNGVSCIAVRDRASFDEMKKLGISSPRFCVTADPVLLFENARSERGIAMMKEHGIAPGEFGLVSLRPWRGLEGAILEIAKALDAISADHGLKMALLPMQSSQDLPVLLNLRDKMKSPAWVIDGDCLPCDVLEITRHARFVVGMRLHSLMFALKALVPFLALPYDPKVTSFAREAEARCAFIFPEGRPLGSHAPSCIFEAIASGIEGLLKDSGDIKAFLRGRLDSMRTLAEENMSLAAEILDRSSRKC